MSARDPNLAAGVDEATGSCLTCAKRTHLFLGPLGESRLRDLDGKRESRLRSAGTCLFRQGEEVSNVHCIDSAVLKFSRRSPGGRDTIVDTAGQGRLAGLVSIFGRGDHAYSAEVVRAGNVCTFDRATIEVLALECSQFARALYRELALELHRAASRIGLLSCSKLEPKLALLLLDLAETRDPSEPVIEDFSRRDLAQMCGVSTEALVRCLSRWKSAGVIDTDSGAIMIRDGDHLKELGRQV
ncbi:MAG: hypothetical protein CME06_07900 [Gemmatimonadetes bacterium]|nr:hypothetical protein [Gemmatimonadota bacterium]